jgi:hypothetical protein
MRPGLERAPGDSGWREPTAEPRRDTGEQTSSAMTILQSGRSSLVLRAAAARCCERSPVAARTHVAGCGSPAPPCRRRSRSRRARVALERAERRRDRQQRLASLAHGEILRIGQCQRARHRSASDNGRLNTGRIFGLSFLLFDGDAADDARDAVYATWSAPGGSPELRALDRRKNYSGPRQN